jgi:hypothetical protein
MNIDINVDSNKVYTNDYKSMPFFIHAPGNGFLNNIIIKLGYGNPDNEVKKKMTYAIILKLYYQIKRVIMEHKYIFLSMVVILVIIIVSVNNNIMNNKNKMNNKNNINNKKK